MPHIVTPGRILAASLTHSSCCLRGLEDNRVSRSGRAVAFNGLSVGAVYALLALGFTLVYSTVWFFDLLRRRRPAWRYGVFYLRTPRGWAESRQQPERDALFALVLRSGCLGAYSLLHPAAGPLHPQVAVYRRWAARSRRSIYSGFVLTTRKPHVLLTPLWEPWLHRSCLVVSGSYSAFSRRPAARQSWWSP